MVFRGAELKIITRFPGDGKSQDERVKKQWGVLACFVFGSLKDFVSTE